MICPNCKEDRGDLHLVRGRLVCSQCKKKQVKSSVEKLDEKIRQAMIPPSVA